MNHDNNHPIDPELETRVVAWVLGEASPFEAAELERLLAENPGLAVFKRRIEAVHGLLGEAARPAPADLRLAPERRAKLLAVLGAGAADVVSPGAPIVPLPARPRLPSWVVHWQNWALPAAACLTLLLLVSAVMLPTVGKVRETARSSVERSEARQREMARLIAEGEREQDKKAVADLEAGAAGYAPEPQTAYAFRAGEEINGLRRDGYDRSVSELKADSLGWSSDDAPANTVDSITTLERPAEWGGEVRARRTLRGNEVPPPAAPAAASAAVGGALIADEGTLSLDADVTPAAKPVTETAANTSGIAFADKAEVFSGKVAQQRAAGAKMSASSTLEKSKDVRTKEVDAPRKPLTTLPPLDESLRAETAAAKEPVSTFSLHVSDASYRLARAALERGERPDPSAIRPEEFYNAFDYGDPAPAAGEPVACRVEQSAHPFLQQRNLVRVALRVPAAGRGAGVPLHLTVLLDTSGSMEREDRAETVRAALTSLASLLGPADRVSLVGFARTPRLLAEGLPGDQAAQLADIAARTPAEGGTNLEEALKTAAELAARHFNPDAQNRVVLLTDGAANLGDADPARLAERIDALRRQGVAFDACGVGLDGLDDAVLEALTRRGDGRYQVLDSPAEADAGFARKLAGAFRPAAENVKVQVRFNPARVGGYRLIGFEKHRLREEDFRDDRDDAAELAAEEAAVAIYQVEVLPEGEGDLGDVAVRFRDPASGAMVERTWPLIHSAQAPAFDRASSAMRLAGSAAFLAEKLRGGDLAGQIRLDEFAPVVSGLRGDYAGDARVLGFVEMFARARRLTGE